MKKISICIPTYEMNGLGIKFLKNNLDIFTKQKFQDFDVVVSDHSQNNEIEKLCLEYKNILDIHYYKNNENLGNSSANINNAIKKASGKIIKILFQDDFLYNENSLKDISENFDIEKDFWLITACEHTKDGISFIRPFYPTYNHNIHLGKNTISSPSVLSIKNNDPLLFDENLKWLMDCDYYKRCYNNFGKPKILNTISVVNRMGGHQISNTLANQDLRFYEYKYILKKYERGFKYIILFIFGYIKHITIKIIQK